MRAERRERRGGGAPAAGACPALGAEPRGLGGGRVYCSPRGACRARLSPQHGVALSAVCVRRARDAGLRAGTAAPGAPRSAAAAVATRRSSLLPAAPRLSGAQAAGDAPAPALPPPWAGSGTRLASALRSPPALRAMGSPAGASAAAATDSAQWLSVKEETIFLHDGLIRVTDLAELPSEIIGVAEPGDTELEVRRPPELRGGTGEDALGRGARWQRRPEARRTGDGRWGCREDDSGRMGGRDGGCWMRMQGEGSGVRSQPVSRRSACLESV